MKVKSFTVACFTNMTVNAILKGRSPFVTSKCSPPTAISLMQFIYIKQDEQREV
jgi:hypothetical protein